NNTTSSISSAITAINNNTNSIVVSSRNDIINAIALFRTDITARLEALAVLVGVINADMKIALQILGRIELKPDCPEPPSLPGSPNVDDVVKPEEPKTGNNPRIQAVTIVLTVLPRKGQWGGGSGAPDKQIAGWFAWKVDGYGYLSQEPINYQQSTYIRPANVSGYAYTLTNSAKGFAIEHTLK
ncbi:hypothetical protein QT972_33455, partial [Microcoleus sp. herbarium7]|uniref:hypothetical protein n=1 Tax=Microcoleus sp. herbarium7 TaxID=3055435 RepID=UPI002FD74EE2